MPTPGELPALKVVEGGAPENPRTRSQSITAERKAGAERPRVTACPVSGRVTAVTSLLPEYWAFWADRLDGEKRHRDLRWPAAPAR